MTDANPRPLAVPSLSTARLQLVPLTLDHRAGMFELWSAPEVCRYAGEAQDRHGNPIVLPAREESDSNRIIEFFSHHLSCGTAFRWAVLLREDQVFAGAVGFNSLGGCAEIAYHLVPRHWGCGYMSEACDAAVGWAFEAHGATAVDAFVEPANQRSRALLERLGFEQTGESREGANRFLHSACARATKQ